MSCKTTRRLKNANRNRDYYYYKCSKAHGDIVYQAKRDHRTYYRADLIEADLWA